MVYVLCVMIRHSDWTSSCMTSPSKDDMRAVRLRSYLVPPVHHDALCFVHRTPGRQKRTQVPVITSIYAHKKQRENHETGQSHNPDPKMTTNQHS